MCYAYFDNFLFFIYFCSLFKKQKKNDILQTSGTRSNKMTSYLSTLARVHLL